MNWYKKAQRYKKRKWSKDDLQVIKELIQEGYSLEQVGDLVGMSANTISKLNKEYGLVDFETRKLKRDKWIVNLYLLPPKGKGLSTKQIGSQYGIPITSIKRALKRFGLSEKYRDRAYYDSPENKEMISTKSREQQSDPVYREWMSEMQKQRYIDNPDLHRQRSEQAKKVHQDNPQLGIDSSNRLYERWKKYPGGLLEWLNTFPPEKRKPIRDAVLSQY